MDVIKRMAERFSDRLISYGSSLEKFDGELNSKLIYISKTSEKLRFLAYLRDMAETEYKKHAKVCPNPDNCATNRSLDNALYGINQQYNDYFEIEGGVNLSEKPTIQFFKDGQYFDAFTAIRDIIMEAKDSIILVDGYVNTDTLAYFPGKEPQIKLQILTNKKCMDQDFQRAIVLYNKQYGNLEVATTNNFHDRFLVIDDINFYHIGASIKDAGNKIFMFTKIQDESLTDLVRKKIKEEWNN